MITYQIIQCLLYYKQQTRFCRPSTSIIHSSSDQAPQTQTSYHLTHPQTQTQSQTIPPPTRHQKHIEHKHIHHHLPSTKHKHHLNQAHQWWATTTSKDSTSSPAGSTNSSNTNANTNTSNTNIISSCFRLSCLSSRDGPNLPRIAETEMAAKTLVLSI